MMRNMYIEPIYLKNKIFFGLLSRWALKDLLRRLKKMSPNFGELWQLADFLKILEKVFMYDNSPTNALSSSMKYEQGANGFILKTEEFIVTFKLYSDTKLTKMEVTRQKGNKIKSSMDFYDDKEEKLDEHDTHMLLYTIEVLMAEVSRLIVYYYNLKKV